MLKMLGAGDCQLDEAIVTTIPPATFRIVAVYHCGLIVCWQRWLEVDGKILGLSRACERPAGEISDKIMVP